jgi:hypothetical protein
MLYTPAPPATLCSHVCLATLEATSKTFNVSFQFRKRARRHLATRRLRKLCRSFRKKGGSRNIPAQCRRRERHLSMSRRRVVVDRKRRRRPKRRRHPGRGAPKRMPRHPRWTSTSHLGSLTEATEPSSLKKGMQSRFYESRPFMLVMERFGFLSRPRI